MRIRTLLFFILLPFSLLAQYTTPNTGLTYSLDDLVSISDGVVTGGPDMYVIHDTLIVAPTDTLEVLSNPTVEIAPEVRITIQGGFMAFADALFTRQEGLANYSGFRFESESSINLEGPTFEYGGGLKVITGNFQMVDCIVRYQSTEASSGAAVGLSTGSPLISNCTFVENESAAIGSAANSDASPSILNCTFTANNTGNSNRPQINLGPSGTDTIRIINNTVVGNPDHTQVGGVAISNFIGGEAHAIVSGNEVRDNRYGIAMIGNGIDSRLEGNIIEDNNIQGDPMLGGSGININASDENYHIILNNQIRGNLWGITLQGTGNVNLGEYENENVGEGGNVFSNNENGGQVYALYNNTSNTIYAEGNCWLEDSVGTTLDDVENVIFHQADDASLGEVIYDENLCAPSAVAELDFSALAEMYPNPTVGNLRIELNQEAEKLVLLDMRGREIRHENIANNRNVSLDLSDLKPGIYLVRITGASFSATGKVTVQ